MKEIKYTILYCVCENFCDSFYYGSGSLRPVMKYYGPVPLRQIVPVLTVPVPQHWIQKNSFSFRSYQWNANNWSKLSTFYKYIKSTVQRFPYRYCFRCFTDIVCHTKERIRNRQLTAVDRQKEQKCKLTLYLTPVRNELATTVCSIRNKSSGFVAAVVVAGTRQNNNLSQEIIFNLAISKHWG